jgi:transposase-like protein
LKKIESGKMEAPANIAKKGLCMDHHDKGISRGPAGYLTPQRASREFCAGFLDEGACRSWILGQLHREGPRCPECRKGLQEKYHNRFWQNERIRCPLCGKWFTALTDTIFQGTHMGFREILLLAVFLGLNQPAKYIAEILDIDEETVRLWRCKFNQVKTVMRQ